MSGDIEGIYVWLITHPTDGSSHVITLASATQPPTTIMNLVAFTYADAMAWRPGMQTYANNTNSTVRLAWFGRPVTVHPLTPEANHDGPRLTP